MKSRQRMRLYRLVSFMLLCCMLLGAMEVAFAGEALGLSAENGNVPKYIFLFIGDGMGLAQATALGNYRGASDAGFAGTLAAPTPDNPPQAAMPSFTQFPEIGLVTTYDASKFVTDSAAAGTAIACGVKTLDGVIGKDAFGNDVSSVATHLQQQLGYEIGIITSVALDHATPAAFYAHSDSRSNYYEIGTFVATSGFAFFGGGSFLSMDNEPEGSTPVLELAQQNGYGVANTNEAILALNRDSAPVLAISPVVDASMSLPYALDNDPDALQLKDFVQKGIDVLSNDTGFLMMCEGGKIDWAAHHNDVLTLIKEVEAFEAAVEVAVAFYRQHPEDTLILVTGDHETGGLSMGHNLTAYDTYYSVLDNQSVTYEKLTSLISVWRQTGISFEAAMDSVQEMFGLLLPGGPDAAANARLVLNDYEVQTLRQALDESLIPIELRQYDEAYLEQYSYYTDYEPFALAVTRTLNSRAGFGWTTTLHSGSPVPIYALGAGAESYRGMMDNTDITPTLMSLCGLAE